MSMRVRPLWVPLLFTVLLSVSVQSAALRVPRVPPWVLFTRNGVSIVLAPLWMVALPFMGSLGAWLSRRAGGTARDRLLSALGPAWLNAGIGTVGVPLSMIVERHFSLSIKLTAYIGYTIAWCVVPAVLLTIGALPWLGRKATMRPGLSAKKPVTFRPMIFAALLLTATVASATVAVTEPGNESAAPVRIADNVYYVGASDIASYLITTPAGHILIDAGYAGTVPLIRRNVEKLGFKIRDVKILLNTQAHIDHAGGFAALKKLTGARLEVSDGDASLVEDGGRGDYLFGSRHTFPPAHVDRPLHDGDRVELGGVVLTAHLTPGHTPGCTTWTFDATDRGRTYHVVVVGGATINPGTKVRGMPTYPTIARDYAHTFDVLTALPCDIFLGAHRVYYDGAEKMARLAAHPTGPNPLVDPAGYRAAVAGWRAAFERQLAAEGK